MGIKNKQGRHHLSGGDLRRNERLVPRGNLSLGLGRESEYLECDSFRGDEGEKR